MRSGSFLLAGLVMLGATTDLHAQERNAAGRLVYEAGYFQQYSPSNALQIVRRVPGFTLDAGSEEVRGFGQAAGNVVINGQRPATKSETLETVLARIPASRVQRVEIASGDMFGADYAGKPQVVNLVLGDGGGVAGTLDTKIFRDFTGRLHPTGSASALVRSGASTFTLAAKLDRGNTADEGSDILTSLPSGAPYMMRHKENRYREPSGTLSASWAHDEGEDRTAHLNASYGIARTLLNQDNHVIPAGGAARDDSLVQRYRTRTVELGGDVTRPLAGGGLKLVALATRRHRVNTDEQLMDLAAFAGGSRQELDDESEESVARLAWSRRDLGGWSVELGGEGAYNRLDSAVAFYLIDPAHALTRVDLPLDDATVKETRGEAFINAGRALSSRLRIDLGLTYEASRLTVAGDVSARRSLRFLKPRATFDWSGGAWHAQFSVQRTVAQLNFADFVSGAELANDRVNGGNSELVPQRAWELLFTADRALLGDGRIKIELGYHRVEQVQDRIPTPEGFDAPGNLGDGEKYIARLNLDVPLGRLGIKGGRLTLYGSYVGTSVRDPLTGQDRNFSNINPFYWEGSFRQDLGRFAWGISMEGYTRATVYRLDELDRFSTQMPVMEVFAEYRPNARTTFSFGVENALNRKSLRERLFYTPNRANPAPYLRESRDRNRHFLPYVSVRRSFG